MAELNASRLCYCLQHLEDCDCYVSDVNVFKTLKTPGYLQISRYLHSSNNVPILARLLISFILLLSIPRNVRHFHFPSSALSILLILLHPTSNLDNLGRVLKQSMVVKLLPYKLSSSKLFTSERFETSTIELCRRDSHFTEDNSVAGREEVLVKLWKSSSSSVIEEATIGWMIL